MPPKQAGCASWPAEAIHLEDVMFVADRPTTAVDNYININRINAARWRQTGYGSDRNRCACRCDHTPYIRKTRWLGGGNNNLFISISPKTFEVFRVSLDFLGGKISEQNQTDVVEPCAKIRPGEGENIGRFKTCFGMRKPANARYLPLLLTLP